MSIVLDKKMIEGAIRTAIRTAEMNYETFVKAEPNEMMSQNGLNFLMRAAQEYTSDLRNVLREITRCESIVGILK